MWTPEAQMIALAVFAITLGVAIVVILRAVCDTADRLPGIVDRINGHD